MGQVGSSSVHGSLISCGIEPIFHVHWMSTNGIGAQKTRRKDMNITTFSPALSHGEWLYTDYIMQGKRVKIITIVREPISQVISNYFANFFSNKYGDNRKVDITTEELIRIFWDEARHTVPLNWFDAEMKQALGIDIYAYPFSHAEGHTSIKEENIELLILKMELDDSVKEKVIAEFLGVEDFKMIVRSNTANSRGYAQTYSAFKEAIGLPDAYVEVMCNSKYMMHFYSANEIEATKLRWQNRAVKIELPTAIHEVLVKASKGLPS